MGTMENVAGTQSYNEKFDEIYKKLDEILPDEDLSDDTESDAEPEKQEKKEENKVIFNDGMRNNYGKALNKNLTFYMPVKAEDLIKYGPKELSEMYVSMSFLRRRLVEGTLDLDGLVKEIELRNTITDDLLGWVFDLDRELTEIKKMAAMESEDETEAREEMLKKLKGDLEKLPTEKLQEMLSNLCD